MLDKTFDFGDTLAFVSNQYGTSSEIQISCSNNALASFLGLDAATQTVGTDADVKADLTSSFDAQTTVIMDGNKVKITDVAGFEMDFVLDAGKKGDVNIEVTDIGTMTLQIGSNEHQTCLVYTSRCV